MGQHWGLLWGPRGQGWPGRPQGATYSLRRLGSPWKTLALRQPMRLLERSLQGKRRGCRGWGHPTVPAPPPWSAPAAPRGGCGGTYRRFSSGRPRKAPGWTVLIRLFFRSLRGDRHRPPGVRQGARDASSAPSTGDPAQRRQGHERTLIPPQTPAPMRGFLGSPRRCKTPRGRLISSFPSHFPLVISPKGAGKARGSPLLAGGTPAPGHAPSAHRRASHARARWRWPPSPPAHCFRSSRTPVGYLPHAG